MKEFKDEPKKQEPNFFRFGRTETGTPVMEETFGRNKWIEFGKNNDYPNELIRLYQNASGLHSRLIDQKVDMIAGQGFNPVLGLEQFIDNQFSKDKLDAIAYKCAFDLVLFGGYYMKVIWNKKGTIAQIDHTPFEKVRIEKPFSEDEETEAEVKGFYISSDWKQFKKEEFKPVWISAFDEYDFKQNPEQLLFVKRYTPGLDYYCLPSYAPVLNWIKLDYEISTYHLKNVQNGLMPSMVIINKSIPPAQEREALYNELKKRYSGADNAGDFIMLFAESAEKAPEFVPVQLNASDQRFKDLCVQIDNEIMRAHKFTSAIAGIETAGKLGSKNEIQEQLEMFQLTVVRPLQKLVEDSLNLLAGVNGLPEKIELKEYTVFKEVEADEVESTDKNAEAQAVLRGSVGGVQSLTLIIQNVAAGLMSRTSALATIELIFGFSSADAMRLLGDVQETEPAEETVPSNQSKAA